MALPPSDVERLSPGEWRVTNGHCHISASGIRYKTGMIQVVLAASVDGKVVHRDKVTLSSSRSRKRFLNALGEKNLSLPDDCLLQLEEAIRKLRSEPDEHKGPSPDISGTVVTLSELEARIKKHLLIEDPDLIPVVLGATAAHRLAGDQPWLLLVGASGGAKTEILNLVFDVPETFWLSDLTENTLASGFGDEGDSDPSLLIKLKDNVLVVKDFTTVLSMHPDKRQAVLAQLREVYDGYFSKNWGTGKRLEWEGRLGFLAAVTATIDKHHGVMAILGPRFLLFRLRQPDRRMAGRRAVSNSGKDGIRRVLSKSVSTYFAHLPQIDPRISGDQEETLVQAADFVTRARTVVERDGYTRELLYRPLPEMPTRFPRALSTLARGIALYRKHALVTQEDLLPVLRVAADAIPPFKRERVKPIPSWNSSRLLIAYAAFFFNVVVSIFSCRFNASRSLGRCR